MQFAYHENSSSKDLLVEGTTFLHIFKSRRVPLGSTLAFRNLVDDKLYIYKVLDISRRDARCELVEIIEDKRSDQKEFILAWCVVDPKTIEKTLPMLNELGVKKIIFVYTQFSQKNFKIDLEKLKRILINSCEQCGRADIMSLEILESLDEFMAKNSNFGVLDFSTNKIDDTKELPLTWLVGCEGGFSENEKKLLSNYLTVGFENKNIMRSQTAVVALVSKIVL